MKLIIVVGVLLAVAAAEKCTKPTEEDYANMKNQPGYLPFWDIPTELTHGYTAEKIACLISKGNENSRRIQEFPPYPTQDFVDFYCQNRGGPVNKIPFRDPDVKSKLDPTKPLVMLLHGWMDEVTNFFVQDSKTSTDSQERF